MIHLRVSKTYHHSMQSHTRVLEQFGSALQKLVPGVRQEPASMPSTSEPSTERTEAQAAQKLASVDARYEPLQSEHVDIIIRVPGSFKKMGIAVDETGIIMKAPGALFDQDYRILTVDGKSFRPGLQDEVCIATKASTTDAL